MSKLPFLSKIALTLCLTASTFSVFSTTGAGALTTSTCSSWIQLIDISSNQPHPINWSKVVKSGVAGVYIKATENTTYTNPFYDKDRAQAVANGIPYGGYDFARPDKSNAVAEAKYFVAQGGADGQLPPALDLEIRGKTTIDTLRWAFDWLNTVGTLTGRFPIIYTGAYYPWSSNASLGSWDLWLAAYPNSYQPTQSACKLPLPKVSSPWTGKGWSIWQFSSRGSVPGISFNVDRSVATPEWFKFVTNAGTSAPADNGAVTPVYSYGSKGTAVTYVQRRLYKLNLLPYVEITSIFDRFTETALKKYQSMMGVPQNGQWDVTSVSANIWYLANHRPIENATNYPVLKVKTPPNYKTVVVQRWLRLPATGVYNIATRNAVAKFQKLHHLPVSGVVNLETWRVLWRAFQ